MNNNSSKIFIIGATLMLLISIGINGALFVKVREQENTIKQMLVASGDRIKDLKDGVDALIKSKYDLALTLNECNAALASVQAKPVAVPTVCPAYPLAPACPEAPACPAVPVVTCPAIPKPAATPIATPVPARIIYRYKYIHHHIHYRKPAAKPDCDKYND